MIHMIYSKVWGYQYIYIYSIKYYESVQYLPQANKKSTHLELSHGSLHTAIHKPDELLEHTSVFIYEEYTCLM